MVRMNAKSIENFMKQGSGNWLVIKERQTAIVTFLDDTFEMVEPGDVGLDGQETFSEYQGKELTKPSLQVRVVHHDDDQKEKVLKNFTMTMAQILFKEAIRNDLDPEKLKGVKFRIERYAKNQGGRVDIMKESSSGGRASEDDILQAIDEVREVNEELEDNTQLGVLVQANLKEKGLKATKQRIVALVTEG